MKCDYCDHIHVGQCTSRVRIDDRLDSYSTTCSCKEFVYPQCLECGERHGTFGCVDTAGVL